jgi:hypothetical protein
VQPLSGSVQFVHIGSGADAGLIESPSQACLPGLRAWVEVGWIALSQCPRAFLPQPISI